MESSTSFMHTPIIFRFEVAVDISFEDLLLLRSEPSQAYKASSTATELILPPISNLVSRVRGYLSQPSTPCNSPVVSRATSPTTSRARFWHKLSSFLELLAEADPPQQSDPFESEATSVLQKNSLVLCTEGVGGTYFLLDNHGEKFGVFKPVDEEPGAANNPKKLVSDPLLPPGGGAIREVAAFTLDRGWAGVPPTFLVRDVNTQIGTKTGSIQKFVPNDGESSSLGSSSFIIDDVHRIGILDVRLVNMDRNGENMLLKKEGEKHHLIPIDHTYILPEKLDGDYFFEWMHWPQAKVPFSEGTLDYIASINLEADARALRELGIPEQSIRTMLISTIMLKHCVSIGKTLFDVAVLMCRDHSGQPSQLEVLVELAERESQSSDTNNFCVSFQKIIQENLCS